MKTYILKDSRLPHDIKIKYVISDRELQDQVKEIFQQNHYGAFADGKKDVYIDLGANTGLATIYFHYILGVKSIHAVEPNKEVFKTLVKNVGNLTGVKTYNVAWANGDGKDMFYSHVTGQLPQTFWARSNDDASDAIDCVKPSTFFKMAKIKHVDVLKIDVEESEYIIFPDDDFGEVSKKIDCIVGESHHQNNGGFPEIIPSILEEWGYTTEFVKIPSPNYRRMFVYQNLSTNKTKQYTFDVSTIFKAWKRK